MAAPIEQHSQAVTDRCSLTTDAKTEHPGGFPPTEGNIKAPRSESFLVF